MLSSRQQLALWQSVIHSSQAGRQLLDTDSVAVWADAAWSLLRQYAAGDPWQHGGGSDLRTLLKWGTEFERALRARQWQTREHVLASLQDPQHADAIRRAPHHLHLLDLTELTPLEQQCLGLLEHSGWRVEHHAPKAVNSNVTVRRAANSAEELDRALQWLNARLAANAEQRVALVVPQASFPVSDLRRRIGQRSDTGFASGRAPLEFASVSAALNALELLGPRGGAHELSAWLRSPFMQGFLPQDLGDAARFELLEREAPHSQIPVSLQRSALMQRVAQHAPRSARRLQLAIEGPERPKSAAVLTVWTRLWREQLQALGWMSDCSLEDRERAVAMLESGFDRIDSMAAMLGALDAAAALAELRSTLDEALIGSQLPVYGLHVLTDPDDLGPGYSAAWVMGVSHHLWPQRKRPNPLLPLGLQRRLEMPWASVDYARKRAERTFMGLARRVPELVLSWPAITGDEESGPAAVLDNWAPGHDTDGTPFADLTGGSGSKHPEKPQQPGSDPRFERLSESITPLPEQSRVSGGARLLDLQASCPLRAFIEFRLHAREVPRRYRGISRALRGKLLHHAAACLMPAGTDSGSLTQTSAADWSARVGTAARRALQREFSSLEYWFGELMQFEQRRIELTLSDLLSAELRRGNFQVNAVEEDVVHETSGIALRARIDRMDRLDSGGFAILDYKTGSTGAVPHWFDPDCADFQLPLYAIASNQPVSALVLCSLAPESIDYRGFWLDESAFPRKPIVGLSATQWQQQLAEWRAAIDALISHFAAGDASVFAENIDLALGMYAPLTRLSELHAVSGPRSDA
jgi:probable DNA repair protein